MKQSPVTSVHLTDFPVASESLIDKTLEERMKTAQQITSLALALRRKVNIKVRQPLSRLLIPITSAHQQASIESVQALILNETNIKTIQYTDSTTAILIKRIKPDYKKLGPRYGKIMKDLSAAISILSQEEISTLEKSGTLNIQVAGQTVILTTDDVEILSEDIPGWLVASDGKHTVALDITITEDLKLEGIARELINRIQNIRKTSGYEITDKISIIIQSSPNITSAVEEHREYIASQVLAVSITLSEISSGTKLDMDDSSIYIQITKN
ncbi:MAG: DUF5915 domain-containing protein [Dysgonamonadaceae bacterium]|jgi:isoleucyl-tRNA synthetase|nr:DUF5915 domain-containing protein [Dysgonamonadaceae bacterium]